MPETRAEKVVMAQRLRAEGLSVREIAERMGLEPHHVIPKHLLKREGRRELLFDLRNRMLLCSRCHRHHTDRFRLVSISRVPDEVLAFAVDFFGDDARAADWFARHYGRTA